MYISRAEGTAQNSSWIAEGEAGSSLSTGERTASFFVDEVRLPERPSFSTGASDWNIDEASTDISIF